MRQSAPAPVSYTHLDVYKRQAQQCIGNQVLLLKGIQHGQRLPMKAGAEPARQFLDGADPFAGGDCVTDPVNTAI